MGRPRKQQPPKFREGQLVEPTEAYVGDIDGHSYVGHPGVTRLDGGAPQVQAWPHLHKLVNPNAYKEKDDDGSVS